MHSTGLNKADTNRHENGVRWHDSQESPLFFVISSDVLINVKQPSQGKGRAQIYNRFIAFADFHEVSTPTMVNFALSMGFQLTHKIPVNVIVGFREPVGAGSSIPR